MVLNLSPATNWSRASYMMYCSEQNSQTEEWKTTHQRYHITEQNTCERSSSAWEKFPSSNSHWALFLRARASKLLETPTESESRPDNWMMRSAARAGVPQWPMTNPSGKTATLGPAPHLPKQPEGLTTMVGGARALRISRARKEPWRRQVRLVQTRISWWWVWAWIELRLEMESEEEEKEVWFGFGRNGRDAQRKHTLPFIPPFYPFAFRIVFILSFAFIRVWRHCQCARAPLHVSFYHCWHQQERSYNLIPLSLFLLRFQL